MSNERLNSDIDHTDVDKVHNLCRQLRATDSLNVADWVVVHYKPSDHYVTLPRASARELLRENKGEYTVVETPTHRVALVTCCGVDSPHFVEVTMSVEQAGMIADVFGMLNSLIEKTNQCDTTLKIQRL